MNTFTLKCTALLFMVIDHIGLYFADAPSWFRLLGRCSYPLFLFCMVWGYHYTRSRKVYLMRLYLMSLFMAGFRCLIDSRFPTEEGYGNHNIFVSLFIVGVLISTVELFLKDRKKGALLLFLIFGVQLFYYSVPVFNRLNGDFHTSFVPNLALNEYGFEFVVLGVLMYFLKEKKELLTVTYVIFCISQFSSEMLMEGTCLQSFMILALPLMLRYNGEKGPGMKYFFYLFYPAHTFALFYLANFVYPR